jgi:hypothetical protein
MKPRVSRLPLVLLGAMTALTFGGPIAIGRVLRGGASPVWPPDRRVEWVMLLGVSGAVVVLMGACLSLSLLNRKPMGGPQVPPPGPPGGDRP